MRFGSMQIWIRNVVIQNYSNARVSQLNANL